MKSFSLAFVCAFGLSLVVMAGFDAFGAAMLLVFLVPIEFFVGLLLLFYKRHRTFGGGLLAASGLTILVALLLLQ